MRGDRDYSPHQGRKKGKWRGFSDSGCGTVSAMPSCVTHNYDPDGVFLGNLCDLPRAQAEAVLQRIRESGRRIIRPDYLEKRHRTEEWLIGARRMLLGETSRKRPIYFFLGDFADGRDLSRPCSLAMPLAAFRPEVVTFTYPDSMTSFSSLSEIGADGRRKFPYGQVFTFSQIVSVIDEFGLPGERADRTLAHHERYIELQVWDDQPIVNFLKAIPLPSG